MRKKIEKIKRMIYLVDALVLLATFGILFFAIGYASPLVIAPIDDYVTTETTIKFEFKNGNILLIDDNIDFTSPEKVYVRDNLVITFEPGVYYWKIEGLTESEVREFTIESKVDLRLRESDTEEGVYEVSNAGNVRLNVEVYDKGRFTGNSILDIDETEKVSATKVIGGQGE